MRGRGGPVRARGGPRGRSCVEAGGEELALVYDLAIFVDDGAFFAGKVSFGFFGDGLLFFLFVGAGGLVGFGSGLLDCFDDGGVFLLVFL